MIERNVSLLRVAKSLIKPHVIGFYLLTFGFYTGQANRWQSHQGDAAGYVDSLAASGGYQLNFAYGLSTKRAVELFQMQPIQGCIEGFSNPYSEISFLQIHPYLFSFLSRFFDPRFLSIETWPLLLLSLSYALGVVTLFLLVKKNTNVQVAFGYLALILFASPLFFESLRGQPYLDRLAFGPIILILWRIYEGRYLGKKDLGIFILLCLLTGTFSERAALVLAMLLLCAPIMFKGLGTLKERKTWPIFSLSLFLFTYYYLWTRFFSSGEYSGNTAFQNFLPNLSRLFSGDRNLNFQLLLTILIPFLLLSSIRLRHIGLVILVVLPNLLADVGGAELSGFSTHYLAFILPVVAVTSGLGSVALYQRLNLKNKKFAQSISIVVLLLISGISLNLYLSKIDSSTPHLTKIQVTGGKQLEAFGIINKNIRQNREFREELATNFTKSIEGELSGAITTPEPFMPTLLLHGHRKLEVFPVGIGINDYLIIPYNTEEFLEVEYTFNGAISLENQKLWSNCIKNIVNEAYVEQKKAPVEIGNFILYKKKM